MLDSVTSGRSVTIAVPAVSGGDWALDIELTAANTSAMRVQPTINFVADNDPLTAIPMPVTRFAKASFRLCSGANFDIGVNGGTTSPYIGEVLAC